MNNTDSALWNLNTPSRFWQCQVEIPAELWQEAYARSAHLLGFAETFCNIEQILTLTLGEARYGPGHWELDSLKKTYYVVKPAMPRWLTRWMRRQNYKHPYAHSTQSEWPVEPHYAEFLWQIMRQVMILSNKESLPIRNFWPGKHRFAFVLTHDIETAAGQEFVEEVANLEENLGFRSSFNFVPERYEVNHGLMNELRQRGFEVGVHGLKHDGKLFTSQKIFEQRAVQINQYLQEWRAVGFRADLTHRQPQWMQLLNIEYDLSFFDTDPFEPIPGGTMSIWPFFLGRFVELPYTLVQDYTLTSILNEKTPRIWLEKVDFIEKYHGMALLNSHPDYLAQKSVWRVYHGFLTAVKERAGYWHALPRETARWWRERTCERQVNSMENCIEIGLGENNLEWRDDSAQKGLPETE